MTIDIAHSFGPLDEECMRCGRPIDCRGVLLLDGGDPVCPGCVPPPVAQAAAGLQHVYDSIALDGGEQITATAAALRSLADTAERIARGELVVSKRVHVVDVPWARLVGVSVDWSITDA